MAETTTPLVTTSATGRRPDRAQSTAPRLIHPPSERVNSRQETVSLPGITYTPRVKRTVSPLAEAAMLLAVLFVGTDFVAAKYSLEDLPPLLLAAMRFTLAGVLLCVFVRASALGSAPEKKDLLPLAGLGAVGVSLNQGAYLSGLSMTNGSDAALMFASAPVWGLLFGAVFGLERARLGGVAGILIALLGVGLVVYDGLGQAGASLLGDLLVLLSALSWGAYAVLSLPMLSR